ncbi:hypothetical protein ACI68E_004108 [Malassezia pachydermatis]
MKAIVRGFCLSLLLCACVWADVPIIEEGAAQHISESEPWRIEPFDADAVYDKVQLDNSTTTHPHASRGWADPSEHGGSMLDLVGNGYREPINVIISGQSDRSVLSEQGLLDYVRSIGFSFECLHIHLGGLQHANLGDGNGYVPQLFEYRSLLLHKGAPGAWIGACWESLAGGNHFRVWRQNGTLANTGAWFLAVSQEEDVTQKHTISPNGYDLGRDLLVKAATHGGSFQGHTWRADVDWVTGLLEPGTRGTFFCLLIH